jgi:hypothetical protein
MRGSVRSLAEVMPSPLRQYQKLGPKFNLPLIDSLCCT